MTAVQPAAPVTSRRDGAPKPQVPRRHRSTAPAHPSRVWVRRRFRVALALCAAALATHAYLVGHGAPTIFGGFAEGLLTEEEAA